MVAAAVRKDFANIFTPPPSVDFAALLVGDDLKQLDKRVDQFEVEVAAWRAASISRMQALSPVSNRVDVAVTSPVREALSDAIKAVEDGIETFRNPMHSEPAVAQKIDEISKLSVGTGKFVRKLMRRIEKIRVSQHGALVDIYYGLLAIKSELDTDSEAAEKFSDPAKLGAFLRKQIA